MPEGECCWCFAELMWPYIIDGLMGALCDDCLERWEAGARPPLQPDAIARQALPLRLIFDQTRAPPAVVYPLPPEVLEAIAFFLVRSDWP